MELAGRDARYVVGEVAHHLPTLRRISVRFIADQPMATQDLPSLSGFMTRSGHTIQFAHVLTIVRLGMTHIRVLLGPPDATIGSPGN
jgi:hypothetical protein